MRQQRAIINQDEAAENMSKESIQEVVQKSLEDYFNDLGEQKPTNIYDMMVLTVEKPVLEVVMTRADGNQSHAAQVLEWVERLRPGRTILMHMDQSMDYTTLCAELPDGVEPGYDGLEIGW